MKDENKIIDQMIKVGMNKQAEIVKEIIKEYKYAKDNNASEEEIEFFEGIMSFFGSEAIEELRESESKEKKEDANK